MKLKINSKFNFIFLSLGLISTPLLSQALTDQQIYANSLMSQQSSMGGNASSTQTNNSGAPSSQSTYVCVAQSIQGGPQFAAQASNQTMAYKQALGQCQQSSPSQSGNANQGGISCVAQCRLPSNISTYQQPTYQQSAYKPQTYTSGTYQQPSYQDNHSYTTNSSNNSNTAQSSGNQNNSSASNNSAQNSANTPGAPAANKPIYFIPTTPTPKFAPAIQNTAGTSGNSSNSSNNSNNPYTQQMVQ